MSWLYSHHILKYDLHLHSYKSAIGTEVATYRSKTLKLQIQRLAAEDKFVHKLNCEIWDWVNPRNIHQCKLNPLKCTLWKGPLDLTFFLWKWQCNDNHYWGIMGHDWDIFALISVEQTWDVVPTRWSQCPGNDGAFKENF